MINLQKCIARVMNYLYSGRLQTKTITGTTNAHGAISLGLNRSDAYVCSAECTSANLKVQYGGYGNSIFAWVYRDATTFSPVVNTLVTIRVDYKARIIAGGGITLVGISRLSAIERWWEHGEFTEAVNKIHKRYGCYPRHIVQLHNRHFVEKCRNGNDTKTGGLSSACGLVKFCGVWNSFICNESEFSSNNFIGIKYRWIARKFNFFTFRIFLNLDKMQECRSLKSNTYIQSSCSIIAERRCA